jgi:hypothetical protein
MLDVHLTSIWIDGYVVNFDTEIFPSLIERGMCRYRDDPVMYIRVCMRGSYQNAYISGSVMPFTSRAHSRCVLQDMRIDSVPPEVVVPAPLG